MVKGINRVAFGYQYAFTLLLKPDGLNIKFQNGTGFSASYGLNSAYIVCKFPPSAVSIPPSIPAKILVVLFLSARWVNV